MSSSNPQTSIQELVPLRPMPSANLRESLHIPTQPRPISQETTYTDRTSRRESLEANPPHLAPGERPQIMTATPLNLGPQAPTPPPSPPLLERRGGFKKWFALVIVGAVGLMLILLIVAIVMLATLGMKKHSSTVIVQASALVSNDTATPILAVPRPTLGRREGWISTTSHKIAKNVVLPDHHTAAPISTFTISNNLPVAPTSEISTREEDSAIAFADIIMTTITNMISTATFHSTVAISPAPVITKTITAVPTPTADQSSQQIPTAPPPASVTVDLQFTIKESAGMSLRKEKIIWNILLTTLLAGMGSVNLGIF